MALDFPNAPTDGQVYGGFTWDNTAGLWRVRGNALSPAGVSGVTGTVATTTDGNDTIYSFTGDGTITIATGGIANILLVGGGGSGAKRYNGGAAVGGGGAGGVLYAENTYLPAGALSVVVGAGGLNHSGSNFNAQGAGGEASRLGSYYSPGGGAGGAFEQQTAKYAFYAGNGGSGGGAAYTTGTNGIAGKGTPGLGNDGASAPSTTAGGGGGAGAIGGNPDGGVGVSNSITGSAVFYGGGGAGDGGTGGTGGGGNAGSAGTANTGGGGGAAVGTGHAGGSGIVIVRILG